MMMFETRLTIILEAFMGAKEYSIPNDPKQLLADFYILNQLPIQLNNNNLNYEMKSIRQELVPYLRTYLLQKAALSILSYLYSIWQYVHQSGQMAELTTAGVPEIILREFENFGRLRRLSTRSGKAVANLEALSAKQDIMLPTVQATAMLCGPKSPMDSTDKIWHNCCLGWLKLYSANDLNTMCIYIDHVYDLHHNGGNLLDRGNSEYAGNWLSSMLDIKTHSNDPMDLVLYASPYMKQFVPMIIQGDKTSK